MMEENNKTVDDLDPRMLEYPFVKRGMTIDEYNKEKEYYFSIPMEDHKNGKYKPLWQQKE